MIHYNNGKPLKNIQMRYKTYKEIKETAIRHKKDARLLKELKK